jgi:Protein of unknown function (DUF2799)
MSRVALALLVLLGGCALFPLSEADCKPASWRERGYADGFGGHLRQDLRLLSECRARFGVEIDQTQYLAGWQDGYNEWDRLIGSMGMD